jgi:hypothetical protein
VDWQQQQPSIPNSRKLANSNQLLSLWSKPVLSCFSQLAHQQSNFCLDAIDQMLLSLFGLVSYVDCARPLSSLVGSPDKQHGIGPGCDENCLRLDKIFHKNGQTYRDHKIRQKASPIKENKQHIVKHTQGKCSIGLVWFGWLFWLVGWLVFF